MSYNNFSYFKSPNSQSPYYDQRSSNKSPLEVNRNSKFATDFNKQPRSSYTPNVVLSTSNRNGVIQGRVTQLFSSFGYINDNIIFSKTDVIGPMVQKGDEVSVFASYQPNNPTKYKGERVSKIDTPRFGPTSTSNFGKMKTLSQSSRMSLSTNNRADNQYDSQGPRLGASLKNRLANKRDSSTRGISNLAEFRRSVALKDKKTVTDKEVKTTVELDKDKNKDKAPPIETKGEKRKRIDSTRKSEAAKRKADSPIKFYSEPKVATVVRTSIEYNAKTISKYYENFAYRELDCAAMKNQCPNLTLPKEFFHASLKYQQSFPLNHPMKLGNNCQFKVMDKRVKCIDPSTDVTLNREVDPADADTTFVAKVMLLSTDDLAKFYKDTLKLAEEFDGENKIPITNAIKFLVGSVGQDKEFGIGGAWSPSLDGADPDTNPRVLINTAIRTCKAITGIDLSNCSSWPKFLELHYYRPLQQIRKKKACEGDSNEDDTANIVIDVDAAEEPVEYREPRMETVVYFVPDVWSCLPSADGWAEITRLYLEQLTCIMCPPPAPKKQVPTTPSTASVTTAVKLTTGDEEKTASEGEHVEEEDWNENEETTKTSEPKPSQVDQPTHYSKLVVAGMKIVDIKKELELRKLNIRGVMEQLKARLKAAMDREEADERNKDIIAVTPVTEVIEPQPKCLLSETEKNELKKLYVLPEQPGVIVHQNKKLFGGEMQLQVVTLQSLLSLSKPDLSETTCELAVFAKQFLEMLRRDAVFNVYKSIVVATDAGFVSEGGPEKKAKVMVTTSKRTVDRPLLFSCCLLDREKSGKISLNDLKVLIEGLGICLSSDQLSAVLDKVKDSSNYLNYRQLTDKEMTDDDITNMMNMDVSEDLDYIKELAMGNKALFDSDSVQGDGQMSEDDIERLKNELDKSERCRQAIELKVAAIKDETERNFKLNQTHSKEIGKWKEQATDYKTKYQSELDKSNKYKRELEKMVRQLKYMDKLSMNLNVMVMDTLKSYAESEKALEQVALEKHGEVEEIVMDLTEETDSGDGKTVVANIDLDERGDVEASVMDTMDKDQCDVSVSDEVLAPQALMREEGVATTTKVVVDKSAVTNGTKTQGQEDFDLSKPSDYDMIMLDETE